MRTLTQPLNMSPGGIPPVIHVSQYDSDFTIVFTLFSTVGDFTIESGTTAMVRGTKSSGTGYSADATINISAKTVTVTGNQQMTAAAGQNVFEITLLKGGKEISSKNFILLCERAALDADTITDESVLKELDAIIESADTATQAAEEAEAAADRAEAAAQTLVIDSTPTQGSSNAVSSGGVYEALQSAGLSSNAKAALLACFEHVAWVDEHGQDYYDALESALYEDSTVIGVNRGIGISTSGNGIGTNEKRILSDPIPFTNTVPITVQVKLGSNSYAYNFKFTDTNNKIIPYDDIRTPSNNIGYFKNADNSTAVMGWGTTAEKLTFKDNITNAATVLSTSSGGQVPNGYFRLLFSNASDASGVLPQEPISGYVMVQGKKYTLTEINRTIHVTRGMGTSGTEVVTNEKRMLSGSIPFANKAPITIQMLDSDGTYGYNIKFINTEDVVILSDNICDELGQTALFYDENGTFPTNGWIKDSKQYTLMAGTPLAATDAHSKTTGEQFSGYLRILYCNGTDASSSLPATAIPNKFSMQGLVYTLQES